jgi:signal transduction histidine kinase
MMDLAVQNGSHRFEWYHLRADNTLFPVEVVLPALPTDPGSQVLHTTWRDITDRKRAEARIIQSEKMMTISGLAAGMAHEINNPLAGMMQNAQVIYNRLTRPIPANEKAAAQVGISLASIQEYMEKRGILHLLEIIQSTGNRAAKIVQTMLDFTRKKQTQKSMSALPPLVDRAIDLVRNDFTLGKKYDIGKIKLTRQYSDDLPEVCCDDNAIQQVFFNIIKNAAQAVSRTENPEIVISASWEENFATVRIYNSGPEIPKSVCHKIFEPFFTTRQSAKGTGLGLSIAYFIVVEDHAGQLEVASAPGEGVTFIIRLPVKGGSNGK